MGKSNIPETQADFLAEAEHKGVLWVAFMQTRYQFMVDPSVYWFSKANKQKMQQFILWAEAYLKQFPPEAYRPSKNFYETGE